MSTKVSQFHNQPESGNLSDDERRVVEGGKDALQSLAKTFDLWVAVGRGIKVLRNKAEAMGGRQTFKRLLEQNGYGSIDKAVISKLLVIIDRLP